MNIKELRIFSLDNYFSIKFILVNNLIAIVSGKISKTALISPIIHTSLFCRSLFWFQKKSFKTLQKKKVLNSKKKNFLFLYPQKLCNTK